MKLKEKDIKYLNSWMRPLKYDVVNTTYLFNKNPIANVVQDVKNSDTL